MRQNRQTERAKAKETSCAYAILKSNHLSPVAWTRSVATLGIQEFVFNIFRTVA